MPLARRFSVQPLPFEPQIRWVERASEIVEALAPPAWTTARVEAWLDWADGLPADVPAGTPASLALEEADGLLAGGPDRYARRLAAWGLALGVFADSDAAELFRAELFGALALGVLASGRQIPFGARVNPLAPDPAAAPPLRPPEVGGKAFAEAARSLRAGRGLAAGLPAAPARRLAAVADAVRRCEGDADACASFESNQPLARAARAARNAGLEDSAIVSAIALGRAGLNAADASALPASAVIAFAEPAAITSGSPAALGRRSAGLGNVGADARLLSRRRRSIGAGGARAGRRGQRLRLRRPRRARRRRSCRRGASGVPGARSRRPRRLSRRSGRRLPPRRRPPGGAWPRRRRRTDRGARPCVRQRGGAYARRQTVPERPNRVQERCRGPRTASLRA